MTSSPMREIVAAFWAVWSLYQIVQVFRPHGNPQRLGYFMGALLSSLTSYLLVTL